MIRSTSTDRLTNDGFAKSEEQHQITPFSELETLNLQPDLQGKLLLGIQCRLAPTKLIFI